MSVFRLTFGSGRAENCHRRKRRAARGFARLYMIGLALGLPLTVPVTLLRRFPGLTPWANRCRPPVGGLFAGVSAGTPRTADYGVPWWQLSGRRGSGACRRQATALSPTREGGERGRDQVRAPLGAGQEPSHRCLQISVELYWVCARSNTGCLSAVLHQAGGDL